MKFIKIIRICIIFLLGFLSANLVSYYMVYGIENPISKNIGFFGYSSKEVPFDFIAEEQIEIYNDKIIIWVANSSIGRYAPTGSMKPILDEGTNGIRIAPQSEEEIHIGDIISFKQGQYLIIHRVIDKGMDKDGVYFVTKGDNNELPDGKVRFEDIKYVTIGLLW